MNKISHNFGLWIPGSPVLTLGTWNGILQVMVHILHGIHLLHGCQTQVGLSIKVNICTWRGTFLEPFLTLFPIILILQLIQLGYMQDLTLIEEMEAIQKTLQLLNQPLR